MCRSGRARKLAFGLLPTLSCICVFITVATSSEYGTPIEIKVWDTGRKPLAHMVDVTNEFGLKVLAEHNFLNENNIAFSPYGLMGILVALYEGVDGESSYQLQRGMQLPWNRNVMRIGFRDIHRTLKTYFIPEEGFLAGLALNNENVTFNDDYKTILRFYGFDLDSESKPPPSVQNDDNQTVSTPPTTTNTPSTMEKTSTMIVPSITSREELTTSKKEDTTPRSDVETVSTDVNESSMTTASPSPAAKAESAPTTITPVTSQSDTTGTANMATDATTSTTSSTLELATSATSTSAPTTSTASITPIDTTTVISTTTTEVSTVSISSTASVTEEPTVNNEVEIISTTDAVSSSIAAATILDTSTVGTSPSIALTTTSSTIETQPTTELSTTTPSTPTLSTGSTESTVESLQKRKRSVVDFIYTNPPYVDEYLIKSYDISSSASSFNNDKMFLANGLRNVQVTYMHYNTVLEYAYLAHLEASALRLPLDSDRYYLLIILPLRAGEVELGKLLARMARESDMRDVHGALRPRRIKAIVPSFTVKGHITLTTDLQKLGIRDVFEPRQRDFTLMTPQPGVYVRSIEQAVSVAIRKYQPDDHKRNRYVSSHQPIEFSATYPFLYFVMDSSIHVALMAGKMVDPLNTRIL